MSTKTAEEICQELNIIDDVFFQKIMEDKNVAEEIIQTIMQDKSITIVENETQKYLRNAGTRSVILDYYCKDSTGRYFNVEIQKSDDTNHTRRVRYNASNMDTYFTEKGTDFKDIPDTTVIFISKFDMFGKKRTIYHVHSVVDETGEIVDNGRTDVYVNCKVNDGSEIAELMQYMKKSVGTNPKFPNTSNRIEYFRKEGQTDMCDTIKKYWGAELKEQVEKAKLEVTAKVTAEEKAKSKREEERNMKLMNRLAQEGRTEDIIKATQDKVYKDSLMAEMGI